jgi:hypothetical protein
MHPPHQGNRARGAAPLDWSIAQLTGSFLRRSSRYGGPPILPAVSDRHRSTSGTGRALCSMSKIDEESEQPTKQKIAERLAELGRPSPLPPRSRGALTAGIPFEDRPFGGSGDVVLPAVAVKLIFT